MWKRFVAEVLFLDPDDDIDPSRRLHAEPSQWHRDMAGGEGS